MNLKYFSLIRSNWFDKLYAFTLPALFCGTALFIILTFTFHMAHPAWVISGVIGLILIVSRGTSKFEFTIKVPDLLFALIFLLILFKVDVIGSEEFQHVIKTFMKFAFIPYFFARFIKTEATKYFLYGFVFFASFICLLTVGNLLGLDRTPWADRPVLFSIPRQQGLISLILGGLSVIICLLSNSLKEIYVSKKYFVLVFLQAFLISLTLFLQARGPFVITMIVSFALLIQLRKVDFWKRALTFIIFVVTAYFTINLLSQNRVELYEQILDTGSYELLYSNGDREYSKEAQPRCEIPGNAIAIRTFLYREALSIWTNSPFLGSGVFGFAKNSSCVIRYNVPHNLPLHIGSELGLLGLLLFLAFAIFPFASLLKKMKDSMELKLLILLIAYYLLNFQIAGCSYLECIELYILFGIGTNFIDRSVWKLNRLP